MLFSKCKISFIHRKYSQSVASTAAVASKTNLHASQNNQSFAKNLYVGNFVKDVFTRKIKNIYVPKHEKLYDICVPKEYEGSELSFGSISETYKEFGLTSSKSYIAHGSVVKCINMQGTDIQKKHFLPQLSSGKYIASSCIFEKNHGYDIQNTDTKASYNKINEKWIINGSKQWVVNGEQANIFLVLAKTMDECNRPESNQNFFTAFLVKKSNNNDIQIKSEGDYYSVTFNNVEADCVLGPENDGLLFQSLLFNADLLESSSATLGELKKIIENTFQNFKIHDRSSLIKFGKLNSHLYSMNCVVDFTSVLLDYYSPNSDYELILTRSFVNETSHSCLNLLNDLGLSKKSYKYIENSLLFDGKANLLSFIGALLGIQYAGQFMAEDVRQLRNPLMFPKYTLSHILKIQRSLKDKPKLKNYIGNYLHPSLKKQALDLEYCLSRLHFAVLNMFINLGPDTFYYQMILERTNTIAMDLFAMSAVLYKVSKNLSSSNAKIHPTELIFVNVFCNSVRERCSKLVNEILDAPHNVVDPHFKTIGQNAFVEKNYFFEHPLKRNII